MQRVIGVIESDVCADITLRNNSRTEMVRAENKDAHTEQFQTAIELQEPPNHRRVIVK